MSKEVKLVLNPNLQTKEKEKAEKEIVCCSSGLLYCFYSLLDEGIATVRIAQE